jgi:microcystin degradation protein MlrC
MKVFIGRFGHECNTMASGFTEYADVLRNGSFIRGEPVIEHLKGKPEYLGGVIDFCLNNNVEMVSSISMEVASPPFSKECLKTIMDQIMEDLDSCKNEIDGICFVLHGAGCAEGGIDDLESYVLKKFRDEVGTEMPIMVPLDLHGNISGEMTELADGLFGIKQYPHTDQYESGYLAMKTLYESLITGKKVRSAYAHIPMVVVPAGGYTFEEPFISVNHYIAEYAKVHNLIDASFFHGFPYADVACCSSSIITVGYEGVEECAKELADYIWARRKEFTFDLINPEEALERALKYEGEGYVLLNEASDNPGGGAPGDGTHLLREMLKQDIPQSVFCFIYDLEAVKKIAAAEPGNEVDLILGGKIEKIHGDPIEIHGARVVSVCDGHTISNSPMLMGIVREFGLSARIKVGNVDVIVSSVQKQTLDDRLFSALGIDLNTYRIAAIKSTHHFRAFFRNHAGIIIPVETPGVHCADLSTFIYKKIKRPIIPLDII